MARYSKSPTSVAISILAFAAAFGMGALNRHNREMAKQSRENAARISQQAATMSSMAESLESVRNETVMYGEIKGTIEDGSYNNAFTGESYTIPEGFYEVTPDEDMHVFRAEAREDSTELKYNDLSADIHLLSDTGNAINIDLLYIPGGDMGYLTETSILSEMYSDLVNTNGYTKTDRLLSTEFTADTYEYTDGDFSCNITVLVSCQNSVATIVTVIDSDDSDLFAAVVGDVSYTSLNVAEDTEETTEASLDETEDTGSEAAESTEAGETEAVPEETEAEPEA